MKNFLYPLSLAAVLCTGLQSASAAEFPDTDSDATTATGNRLEDFFTAALNYSPRLAIARERWNIGTARKQAANGQLLPQVMASANLSDNDRTADREPTIKYDGERYLLQMTQVLFNWQAFEARRQAYLLEDQTEAEYYAELADLLTEVADLYLAVLQAEDALRSVDSELEAMTNQINQIQTLYDRQLVQITDLYAGEARLAAIGAQRVNLESELLLAREGLRAVSGVEAGDLYGLPEVIDITPLQGELDEWIARTAANNRLIEARGYALQAAEKRVSQQRGAYMPRVTLVLNRQRSNIGFENAPLPSEAETNYIGIDVTMPLFAGGSNRAAVREALSQRNIADSELRQIRLDMIQNTRLAWSQVKSGEALIAAGQVLAESTATSFTAMQRGFELGTVTSVDVLNALRDQFVSERDLQKARYDHIRATLMLRREAGALTPEDLMNISAMLVE